jgi:hypothetical protein
LTICCEDLRAGTCWVSIEEANRIPIAGCAIGLRYLLGQEPVVESPRYRYVEDVIGNVCGAIRAGDWCQANGRGRSTSILKDPCERSGSIRNCLSRARRRKLLNEIELCVDLRLVKDERIRKARLIPLGNLIGVDDTSGENLRIKVDSFLICEADVTPYPLSLRVRLRARQEVFGY